MWDVARTCSAAIFSATFRHVSHGGTRWPDRRNVLLLRVSRTRQTRLSQNILLKFSLLFWSLCYNVDMHIMTGCIRVENCRRCFYFLFSMLGRGLEVKIFGLGLKAHSLGLGLTVRGLLGLASHGFGPGLEQETWAFL